MTKQEMIFRIETIRREWTNRTPVERSGIEVIAREDILWLTSVLSDILTINAMPDYIDADENSDPYDGTQLIINGCRRLYIDRAGEIVKVEYRCKHCGRWLQMPGVAPMPNGRKAQDWECLDCQLNRFSGEYSIPAIELQG